MASKWQKTLGQIAAIAGPIIGGVVAGPPGAAAGGAIGGALNGKGALKNAGIGALAGYGGAKMLGMQGGGGSNFLSNLNPFKSSTAYANPASAPSAFSGITSSGPGVNVGMGNNAGSWAKALTGQTSTFGGSKLTGNLTNNPLLTGLGTMVGSQFIKSPEVPELPQSVIDFQNAARGGNPLQNQASQALQQQLSMTQQNLGQPEIDALNRQYNLDEERELKQIDSMYKSLRPGTDPLTDSAYQQDLGKVRDRYATLRADSVAGAQRQISNDFNNQKIQQISAAAGLSNQQLQQLATLGQYDLDRQLMQLQITDRDRQTLRDYLLQFGGNLASNQLDPTNALMQQFYQKMLSGAA